MLTYVMIIVGIVLLIGANHVRKERAKQKRAEKIKAYQRKIAERKLYKNMEEWFVR